MLLKNFWILNQNTTVDPLMGCPLSDLWAEVCCRSLTTLSVLVTPTSDVSRFYGRDVLFSLSTIQHPKDFSSIQFSTLNGIPLMFTYVHQCDDNEFYFSSVQFSTVNSIPLMFTDVCQCDDNEFYFSSIQFSTVNSIIIMFTDVCQWILFFLNTVQHPKWYPFNVYRCLSVWWQWFFFPQYSSAA